MFFQKCSAFQDEEVFLAPEPSMGSYSLKDYKLENITEVVQELREIKNLLHELIKEVKHVRN